ncbi:MAG: helix-turn-helix transcriptional regulator [Lachnospiraceae bacterium]|nr:helix-turn-helix transcriptional regulator [Lachnospiraceae bacterium]
MNTVPKYGKFKGFLASRGIKQSEVAELLGISQEAISMKIAGKMVFTLEQVRMICSHYGIRADEFFFEA